MITITVYRKQQKVTGFHCLGHSGYAASGEDIVCAGVSTLVLNTINAIETLTGADFSLDTEEESGLISFQLKGDADHDSALLIDAMLLGLRDIENNYGNEYLTLEFKEV